MKQSYQSVLETVQQVFTDRPQVNSVDSGRELEFDISKNNLFPRVFIQTISSPFTGRWEYTFEVLCMDLVNNDLANIVDVMSTTKSIMEDAISQLAFMDIITPIGMTLTPVYNYQDAQASGWTMTLVVFTTKGLECFDAVP